ncbi:MAG: hypothetical protein J0L94_05300 [Rhodothermia bacterium]|nr:hypothetical protein [Rhodothermia bacterium]
MPFKRKPQENDKFHGYYFSGQAVITRNAQTSNTQAEIMLIVRDLQAFVASRPQGIDYLQVYEHEDSRKIWIIDNISK